MLILAVDPSLHASGWCLLERERPLIWGVCRVPDTKTGDDGLLYLAKQVRTIELRCLDECKQLPALLAYETQYGSPKAGWESISLVGRAAGVWIGGISAGQVLGVKPKVWGAMFELPNYREERKASSLRTAKIIYPPAQWEEDSAEAFLIGLWAYRKTRGQRK
jgi:hypothetical protein